jgi:Flp pilus assembly pilin Flp
MLSLLKRFLQEENAATAVEYAVILALIVGAVLASIGAVGSQAGGMWGGIESDLEGYGFGS